MAEADEHFTPRDYVRLLALVAVEPIKDSLKDGTCTIHDGASGTGGIEAIKTDPGISKPQLVRIVGKSKSTVERAIAALIAAGKIEHRGSKKTGGYWVKSHVESAE